jgi:Mg-chelatase subunit ChlD
MCTGICPAVNGDQPGFTYRTGTAEVRLTFSALDENDHGVATLQASDIAVVDKDIIVRNFQSFTRADWTKLEIGILVDASESVLPHFRHETADILDLVSQMAGVPDENLSLFAFDGTHPALLCARDCRATHTAERLPAKHAQAVTPLFDTIVFAAEFLSHHTDPGAQKVLIVFSDGADTISRNSLDDAIVAGLKSEVQLDCIDLNPATYGSQGAATLQHLARATGGYYFPPPDGAAHVSNVILEGFRASFAVTYRLPNHTSGFHLVRILPTHNLNLRFRSRSGYYYSD